MRVRIICVEFLFGALAAIIAAEGKLMGDEVNSTRDGFKSGSRRVPSPAIIQACVKSAGTLANRNRGKKAVIDTIQIRGFQVVVDVIGCGAAVGVEKGFELLGSQIRTYKRLLACGERSKIRRAGQRANDANSPDTLPPRCSDRTHFKLTAPTQPLDFGGKCLNISSTVLANFLAFFSGSPDKLLVAVPRQISFLV